MTQNTFLGSLIYKSEMLHALTQNSAEVSPEHVHCIEVQGFVTRTLTVQHALYQTRPGSVHVYS